MNRADPSFNCDPAAMAILHLLAQHQVAEPAEMFTYVMHNGREHGVCLQVTRTWSAWQTVLFVNFGTNRNSDQLFVQTWRGEKRMNGPAVDDVPEKAWKDRQYFPRGSFEAVRFHVLELIDDYLGKPEAQAGSSGLPSERR